MKRFRHVPWPRNLRRIPSEVFSKLNASPDAEFVAGIVKSVSISQVVEKMYDHIGFGIAGGVITFKDRFLPLADMGRYSRNNVKGWEVVRKDQPKVTKTFYFETPNFGDWSNGSHTVGVDREVYPRDYFDPTYFNILVTKLRDGDNGEAIFKFTVDCSLDRQADDFEETLLFVLNLLQENVGGSGVLPRAAGADELLSTLVVDWDIFPPGTVDEVVQHMTTGRGYQPTPEEKATIRERIELFSRLKPKRYIQGRGGLSRYTGAMFDDDLVVFENVRYGNALYVLQDQWEEISKRSRMSLMRERDVPFERFVHSEGWAGRFNDHIRAEKQRRGLE